MLMESFVAIMALVAASVIEPGVGFAMNSPAAVIGKTAETPPRRSTSGASWSRPRCCPDRPDVGEDHHPRAGGAPTLAVGMAHILHQDSAARR